MTATIERRLFRSEFETRSVSDSLTKITGYAYKFNSRSQNLGGFREQVMPGAGADSIGTDDIRALMNHDPNLILGRNTAGTLRMSEDSTGLEYEIDADPRQSYVRDLLISLERRDVTQSSFGFEATDESWSIDEEDFPLRSIRSMKLYDVSPVTYPAYLSSESGLSSRSLDLMKQLTDSLIRDGWRPPADTSLDEAIAATLDSEALAVRRRIILLG